MKTETSRHLPVLTLFATGALLASFATHAQFNDMRSKSGRGQQVEQGDRRSERDDKQDQQRPAMYPDAARTAPDAKASRKFAGKLQAMMDLYEADDQARARAAADAIIADSNANAYERSLANQIAAQAAYSMDDRAAAQAYLKAALQDNGLDNDGHYQSMHMLAQLQLQDEQYAPALATLDAFMAETKTHAAGDLGMKGNILYRLQRYPQAAESLKAAIDAAGTDARPEWLQLLMATYFEQDKPDEAAAIAEQALAKSPDDARLQSNLASIYMKSGHNDKAIDMLEKLRAAGKLTEPNDYRNLYAMYSNAEGKEREAIAVIKEGMDKGVLKPDYPSYLALAQAYYFSDQPELAIENYRKAAPLAPDGEAYLNLARILSGQGKAADARAAAQQALDKGVKKPEEARGILGKK